jgi:hypothetical protein
MLAADGAYACLCAAAVTKALSIGHGCAGVSLRALSVLDSREAPPFTTHAADELPVLHRNATSAA